MEPSARSALFSRSPDVTALTDLFNQCFDRQAALSVGRCGAWSEVVSAEALRHAGLAIVVQFSTGGAACLIPQTLLPDWTARPTSEQQQRLQGLAWEWSRHAWPAAGDAAHAEARPVARLSALVDVCQPAAEAQALEILVQGSAGRQSDTIYLVGPVAHPRFPAETAATPGRDASAVAPAGADPLARLRKIPVPVSVRLAEKRISVSQLLSMTPGSLISFSKPLDDLLDLYVNNALYGRGEAVKIGENFGLKVNEVGVAAEQPGRLVNG
jgi:flagellar motor switch protein FliN/FliY